MWYCYRILIKFCLVSFDVADTFPIIDNVSGLEGASGIVKNRGTKFLPAEC